jgi:CheY-like chemotaxis protein
VSPARPYILVVDDDSEIRETFRELLSDEGYEVRTAGDGSEAMSLLLTTGQRPALILLDLMMPKKSGWEVLEGLRRSTMLMDVPIVIVSAHIGSPPAGAVAWVRKPVRWEDLLGIVNRHMKAA